MKKYLLIAIILLLFFSFKSHAQVLGLDGGVVHVDSPNVIVNHAPLRAVKRAVTTNSKDTTDQYFDYNVTDFNLINGRLSIIPKTPPLKPLIPTSDLRQEKKAVGTQKVFSFRNVPPNIDDYLIFRNGTLRPQGEYTVSGNDITIPSAANKDVFELVMLIKEKYW